jgi:hypothetical protein
VFGIPYSIIVNLIELIDDADRHRLRVSENRVLRRIFGPKSYEITANWRR